MRKTVRGSWFVASLLVLGTGLVACGPQESGRIKSDDEADLVGSRQAGAATYQEIVSEAVAGLLSSHSAAHEGPGRYTIGIVGIDVRGAEDLGDWEEQLYEVLANSVDASESYHSVSRRALDRGLLEAELRVEDLFLPKYRRELVRVMEADGNPVQLLIFPNLTTGTTVRGSEKQRDYLMTLELVDVATGWEDRFSGKVRKAYTD